MCQIVFLSLLLSLVWGVLADPQQASLSTTARPSLENPAYDPTIYQQFVPQDAVQKYVQSYNGHNYQNAQGFVPYDPTAYAAIPSQSFQAYLVPATPVEKSSLMNSFRTGMPTARTIAVFFGQLLSFVFGSIGAVALGTLTTAILCFFTPFCTLSFRNAKLLGASEATQEVITALGEQVTAERVKRAADFVKIAIDKFQTLNKEVRVATARKATSGLNQ
ncbi:uncharacterized protein LOC135697352 [Ochlerotatus camptorhynchus]|uniref:uncharacterized protein LOC135697352 n=1 Tax=Ochlerotatus camptorhynchus TaxID=644619 RepID=UPI0031E2C802